MAAKTHKKADELTELTRTLLIVQLGLADVANQSIRAIARCDMNRVTATIRQLRCKTKGAKQSKAAR